MDLSEIGKKLYQDKNVNLEDLSKDIQLWFKNKGFEMQFNETASTWFIQGRKVGYLRKVLGASRALNVIINGESNNFTVEVSTGEWVSNLAVTGLWGVFTGGTMLVVAGVVTAWSKMVQHELRTYIDSRVNLRSPVSDKLPQKIMKNMKPITQKNYLLKNSTVTSQFGLKVQKAKQAYENGVLSQEEYEKKISFFEKEKDKLIKRFQLEKALGDGIIDDDEFERRIKEMS